MHKMERRAVTLLALLGVLAAASPGVLAEIPQATTPASCAAKIPLTEEAEKRVGGALHEGPMESTDAMPGMTGAMPEVPAAMPEMAGAHEVHLGQQGGAFFMAPNKIHHIEAKYSDACGLQLFVYNAFTEPIRVDRFQAFFKIVPEDDSEWDKEVIRFLSPTAAGGVLEARGDHDIEGPFKIELYVKFPECDDAEMFGIPVGKTVH